MTPQPAAKPALTNAPATEPASVSIAQRLRNTSRDLPEASSRDVFALGSAWPAPSAAPQHQEPTGNQFRQTHRLTGALTSGSNAHAMVDGKIISVGDVIDGYRLVSISHRSVEFQSAGGESIILNMAERAGVTVSASAAD